MLSRITHFIRTEIWRTRLKDHSRPKSFLIKQIRVLALAVRGYQEDSCKFRASALTFYSLLSIVPVVAMMFGVAKGFGLEKKVEAEILQRFKGQEKVVVEIVGFANSLLENAKGGFIAGIGVAILFWTIVKVLGNIENSFNEIWGVKKGRGIGRKFSDYLSIMLLCPILLVMAGSATVVVSSQILIIMQKIPLIRSLGPVVTVSLKLVPYFMIWLMFTFVLIFIPNTKVRFKAGLVAGIVSGTIFQLVQWAYINFQIGVAKYGAIYGSFAALPLFLMWLQISWLVVLFGAELAFAMQNVETYEFEQDCLSISQSHKKLLALLITNHFVKEFCRGEKPSDAAQVSRNLEIPIRLVRQILFELVEANVLSEVRKEAEDKEVAYQPARDVETLTIKNVSDALDNRGNSTVPTIQSDELQKLSDCLRGFAEIIEKSPSNISLKAI
jgi:membrane protein